VFSVQRSPYGLAGETHCIKHTNS